MDRRNRLTPEELEALREDYLHWDPNAESEADLCVRHGISTDSLGYHKIKWEAQGIPMRPARTSGRERWKDLIDEWIDEQVKERTLSKQIAESQLGQELAASQLRIRLLARELKQLGFNL